MCPNVNEYETNWFILMVFYKYVYAVFTNTQDIWYNGLIKNWEPTLFYVKLDFIESHWHGA